MSDPGISDRRLSGGFTLVEVLVVLLLVAVATGASLTLIKPRQGDLADEARRVATWLDRLALETRLSGQASAWGCAEGNVLQFERAERDAEGRVFWAPWAGAGRVVLNESVQIVSVRRGETSVECARRHVVSPNGLSEGWVLDMRDAAGGTRRIVGDAFGRFVVAEAGLNGGENVAVRR